MMDKIIFRYKILEKLGAGGMGEVYLAEDTELDRKIALKFLPPQYTEDAEINARFKHEAKAAAALSHPNIVTVYDVGEHEGKAFIAMEYIQGGSLNDLLGKKELSINQIIDIASQICEGLSEAHQAGIFHRDIKPDNILIDAKGRLKIADFGLAKARGRTKLTEEGSTMGTLDYMSPEQIQVADVDHRSDVWSAGVVLYQMVTGQLPFKGDYAAAVSYSILHEDPEPLARYKTDVSEDLQRIIDKALDKDRETRYQNIADMRTDLKREKKGSSEITAWSRAAPVRRLRLQPVKLAWAAGTLVLLSLAALYLLKRPVPQPAQPPRHSQVTFLGDATRPAISPDGKFMAFTRGYGGTVFVQEIGGGRAIEVFQRDGTVWDIEWSPDGSELLIAVPGDGIYLVPRLGGSQRRFPLESRSVVWSADGKRFATRTGIAAITITDKATGASQVITLDSTLVQLGSMDWSPVGDWIVWGHREQDRAVLWTLNVHSRELNRIVEDSKIAGSPRWSPRGDAVYYIRSGGGQTLELWKVPVNRRSGRAEGDPRFLLGGIAISQMSLARDGKRLLYMRHSFQSNLWLMKRESSGNTSTKVTPQEITPGTVVDFWPSVSPDGARLAFTRRIGEVSHIFVVPIEGGEPRQLTFLHSTYNTPAWSPDGTKVAFVTELEGARRIGIVNADGSGEHVLPELGPAVLNSWAPGPRIVYRAEDRKRFHLLDPVSGEETRFPADEPWPNRLGSGRLSPDGRRIGFASFGPERKSSLIVASLDSGDLKTVRDQPGFFMGWTADGTGLYVLDRGADFNPEAHPRIMLIPVEGGEPVHLATLPFARKDVAVCRANPDGSAFVCNVNKFQPDIWLLENFDPEVK